MGVCEETIRRTLELSFCYLQIKDRRSSTINSNPQSFYLAGRHPVLVAFGPLGRS